MVHEFLYLLSLFGIRVVTKVHIEILWMDFRFKKVETFYYFISMIDVLR